MKASEVIAKIEARGGVFLRQRGSHKRFRVEVNGVVCHTTVPDHEIGKGLLSQIDRDLAPALGKGWTK